MFGAFHRRDGQSVNNNNNNNNNNNKNEKKEKKSEEKNNTKYANEVRGRILMNARAATGNNSGNNNLPLPLLLTPPPFFHPPPHPLPELRVVYRYLREESIDDVTAAAPPSRHWPRVIHRPGLIIDSSTISIVSRKKQHAQLSVIRHVFHHRSADTMSLLFFCFVFSSTSINDASVCLRRWRCTEFYRVSTTTFFHPMGNF